MSAGSPSENGSSTSEVFRVALRLGLTSLGGPVAHIGYFERAYLRELGWLTSYEFADIVAIAQLMPGPASTQTGFLIGLRRAGWWGAAAALVGFTMPSAILMLAFAFAAPSLEGPTWAAALHGLQLTAVVIVAQAIGTMSKNLCPVAARRAIAVAACAAALIAPPQVGQWLRSAWVLRPALSGAGHRFRHAFNF